MGKTDYSELETGAGGNDREGLTGTNSKRCSYASATSLEKWLSLVLVVAVLSILGLAIYIGIDRTKNDGGGVKNATNIRLCTTQDCVVFAGEVAATINASVDPCVDFYEYACGGFVATHIRPADVGRLSSFSSLGDKNFQRLRQLLTSTPASNVTAVGKASLMHDTCLDLGQLAKQGTAPLLAFVQSLGGLPVLTPGWSGAGWNLDDVMISVQQRSSAAAFLSIDVEQDQKNTNQYLLHVSAGSLGLGSKTYYNTTNNSSTNVKYQAAYLKEMIAVFTDLGANASDAETAAKEILTLEKKLAAVHGSLTELRDPESTYNKWTVAQLYTRVPQIDWLKVLKGVLEAGDRDRITNATYVIVRWPAYMTGLANILQTYAQSKSTLANYMTWVAIKPTLVHLGQPVLQRAEDFQRETAGVEPKARSSFCVSTTDKTLGYATGRLFVDKYFSPATREAASAMVENIRMAFLDNLPTVTWMDETTRLAAAEKAKAVRRLVGYADFVKNDTALNLRYATLPISSTCHYCNKIAGALYDNKRNYAKLFSTVMIEFGMTAATVNAYYEGTENVVVFPAGILQPSFYYSTGPEAMNYGGIGAVVGHELTHGFDDKGRQYDKEGNLKPWWTEESIRKFSTRASCIADQYSQYKVYGQHVLGYQTLGENIADHGGIKLAYMAYQKRVKESGDMKLPGLTLTLDQLFFVSFARTWCSITSKANALARLRTDVHSPTNFRVIGTVTDDQNFAKAFNCPKGSPMNPVKQCLLW